MLVDQRATCSAKLQTEIDKVESVLALHPSQLIEEGCGGLYVMLTEKKIDRMALLKKYGIYKPADQEAGAAANPNGRSAQRPGIALGAGVCGSMGHFSLTQDDACLPPISIGTAAMLAVEASTT